MAQLSKMSSLRVISRLAVAQYLDDAVRRKKWDSLCVGTLVMGSVRMEESQARVHVQLVDARSEHTLWADEYDRSLQDVLSVRRKVAQNVASALEMNLHVASTSRRDPP